ncbi:MAG TPA: DUF3151 domain-containing protein [Actinomycetota bacterium]
MTRLPIGEPGQTSIQEPDGSLEALAAATDPAAVAEVAARYPTCLAAWATLGELALRDAHPVEAYAYFRVGYHRGLDRIRQAGWRGTGQVPWSSEGNRGFLRSLSGLAQAASAIGEQSETDRCRQFLNDLAPDTPQPGA